ncbi:MAG TPA: asparagine--tRNA ligase [bacterium]|nr:asparagine--tRNA ligase [bacterium]HPT29914.1 asparagine--tRNA ligase [bacterium]
MTYIKDLYKQTADFLDQEIEVKGWIRNSRSSKEFGFIELNDGTFFKPLQVVYEAALSNFSEVEKAGLGSALTVKGKLIKSPKAEQDFELQAKEIIIESLSQADYPLQKKRHSFEFLRTIAHLRSRTNTFSAVFRLRSGLSFAIHKFFQEKGFVYAHTPIITTSDCEGAGEMFNVTTLDLLNTPLNKEGRVDYSQDFFGRQAGLTVSGQLNAEAMALAFNRVYTFGPTFRAENSNTTRHAAEFWMLEPEIYFADLNDDMDLAEEMMKYLINYALRELPEEMKFFDEFIEKGLIARLEKLAQADFKRLTYTEAIGILEKSGQKFSYPVKWGIDLQTEHERYLTDEVFKGPVFVTDYPEKIKAFYMRLNDDGQTVAAMDLLVPGVGEIIGGSQREERLEKLEARMRQFNLCPEDYQWYLDLRQYGGVKHGGFGLGFERLVMYLSGMANIRDVIPFPRTPKNAEF